MKRFKILCEQFLLTSHDTKKGIIFPTTQTFLINNKYVYTDIAEVQKSKNNLWTKEKENEHVPTFEGEGRLGNLDQSRMVPTLQSGFGPICQIQYM